MSAPIIRVAAVLFAFAAPAVAETPAANVEPPLGSRFAATSSLTLV